jgi:hypothetical protein
MEARSGEAHVTTEIKVPDIGDFKEVPVIEILEGRGRGQYGRSDDLAGI